MPLGAPDLELAAVLGALRAIALGAQSGSASAAAAVALERCSAPSGHGAARAGAGTACPAPRGGGGDEGDDGGALRVCEGARVRGPLGNLLSVMQPRAPPRSPSAGAARGGAPAPSATHAERCARRASAHGAPTSACAAEPTLLPPPGASASLELMTAAAMLTPLLGASPAAAAEGAEAGAGRGLEALWPAARARAVRLLCAAGRSAAEAEYAHERARLSAMVSGGEGERRVAVRVHAFVARYAVGMRLRGVCWGRIDGAEHGAAHPQQPGGAAADSSESDSSGDSSGAAAAAAADHSDQFISAARLLEELPGAWVAACAAFAPDVEARALRCIARCGLGC